MAVGYGQQEDRRAGTHVRAARMQRSAKVTAGTHTYTHTHRSKQNSRHEAQQKKRGWKTAEREG